MHKPRSLGLSLLWPLGLLLLLLNSVPDLAAEQSLSNELEFVTIDYPPLLGQKDSLIADITSAAFQAVGIKVNYKVYPLARVVRAVTSNQVVGALGSHRWFYNSTSAEPIPFVRMYSLNMQFFYLKSRFPDGLAYQDLAEFRNYKIGYILGGSLLPVFEKAGIKPDLVRNISQNVQKVYSGRDDMFAATELGGWAIIERHYPEQRERFAAVAKPILNVSGDVIFASQQQHMAQLYLQGLEMIKARGEYAQLIQEYHGNRPLPQAMIDFMQ